MMAKISEHGFHAGWKYGLEFDLWKIIENGPSEYGFIEIDADRIGKLRELSNLTNGWIVFGSKQPEWVPLDFWLKLYQAWIVENEKS